MDKIVRVAIPLKVNPFDYGVPDNLKSKINIGSLVIVPVRNQKFLGIVTDFIKNSPYRLKNIVDSFENIDLGQKFVNYIKWVSKYYFLPQGKVLEFMLPIKLGKEEKVNHPLKKEVFIVKSDNFNLTSALNSFSRLSQKEVVQYLDSFDKISFKKLKKVFKTRVKTVLPKLKEKGMIEEQLVTSISLKDTFLTPSRPETIRLTDEQKKIILDITPSIEREEYLTYLIRGVTGSGKTEIYYQLIDHTIKQGKTCLILLPEIALTDQTISYFLDLVDFSEIALIHSHLTSTQKSNYWYKIAQNQIKLVIGARSAVFAPLKNLGLIVVDEEQDSSYKQSDTAFRYNARDLAVLTAHMNDIPIVLGTATPSLETIHNVDQKKYKEGILTERVNQLPLPDIELIDLTEKDILFKDTLISKPLYWELKDVIKRKEQAIVYLNKRGYHAYLVCKDCGYSFKCDNCDVAYTYYKYEHKLKCHYCDLEISKPNFCPECQSKRIINLSIGTEKVVEDLKSLFPNVAIDRLDRDIITSHNKLTEVIKKVKNRETTILVGTQMVVKGHHFPNVTLVALLLADQGLNFPNFRAVEYTFQDFIQVSGRAGRASKKGKVILQTYTTDHYSINYFLNKEFDNFWRHELEWRKALEYPPFNKMVKIIISSSNEDLLEKTIDKINYYSPLSTTYTAPTKASLYKINNIFRYEIFMRSNSPKNINIELSNFTKFIKKLKLSSNVNIIIDRDPQ